MKNRSNLFIFRGPSSAGKSTVEETLINDGLLSRFKIDTSRPSRGTVADEEAYNFLSEEEFEINRKNGLYASEIILDNGWGYGYPVSVFKDSAKNLVCSIIDEEPALMLKDWVDNNLLTRTVWMIDFNIPKSVRRLLLEQRGDSEHDIEFRLSRSNYDSSYIPDLILTNLYSSTHMVRSFILSKTASVSSSVESFLDRKTAWKG
jgi:guanylate kinase